MGKLNLNNEFEGHVSCDGKPTVKLPLAGKFTIEHFDKNGQLVDSFEIPNGITDEGVHDLFITNFDDGTKKPNWYVGLIDNAGFSAVAAADTSASHAGWTESTAYSNGTRPEWEPDAPASRAVTNGVSADFSINVNSTAIRGAFIISENTKGGATGILWSTGLFSTVKNLDDGDTFRITYSLSA